MVISALILQLGNEVVIAEEHFEQLVGSRVESNKSKDGDLHMRLSWPPRSSDADV